MSDDRKDGAPDSEDDGEERATPSRLRRVLLNSALLCFSSLVALGVAELALRVAVPQQLILLRPDIWMPSDSVGWRHRPDVDTEINTGGGSVRLVTDAEGFRVAPSGRRVRSDSVLLIGDSFMAAHQVEYAQSLAGLIEDSLRGPQEQSIAVRNGGVGGWGPPQYRIFATQRFDRHSYGLALVAVFVGNDLIARDPDYVAAREPDERARFRVPGGLSVDEWIDAVARPLNDYLEQRSHLFVLVKNRTEALRIRMGLSVSYIPPGIMKSAAEGPEWDLTADALSSIATEAEARGTPALFVLIPDRYQIEEDLFRSHVEAFGLSPSSVDLDQPNRRLTAELEERGLNVIDALDGFREAQASGAKLYGSVDPHLSAEGHAVLLDLIRSEMGRLLWPAG